MQNQLQKAIDLVKKTGDRLVVYDIHRAGNAYVVMSLDEYEKLALGRNEIRDLTENELLDKINRDIAVWKNEQYDKEEARTERAFTAPNNFDSNYETPEFKEDFYKSAENKKEKEKNYWVIPSTRKDGAEEIIEEDRQYLEEVF